MLIKDIFTSIQGEGRNIGKVSLFIRMSGCNMSCPFCDTDFKGGEERSIADVKAVILGELKNPYLKNIVITGGEPTIQPEIFTVLNSLASHLKKKKISVELETNGLTGLGNIGFLCRFDLSDILSINLSPKLSLMRYTKDVSAFMPFYNADKVTIKLVVYGVDDLKAQLKEVKRVYGQKIRREDIWVQPIDMNRSAIDELLAENVLGCRLSIQVHKFIGVK